MSIIRAGKGTAATTLRHKEAELTAEQRRLANFLDFIGEGRGSQALAGPGRTERRVETLSEEVEGLRRSREKVFQAPPVEWIKDWLENLQDVLEKRTARSAKIAPGPPRPNPHGARHPGHRPALLPSRHNPRHARLNRNGPRWCGGRFEFFAKVETTGAAGAKTPASGAFSC